MICAGFAVVFGFIQILFFDDLLALDHTASAIRAFILSLYSSGAAAGAGLVILDLGADDLLLGGIRGGAESQTREDPLEELEDQEAGDSDHEKEHDEPEYDHRPIVSLSITAASTPIRGAHGLAVDGESEGVIGISDCNGVPVPCGERSVEDQISIVLYAVRLPCTSFVGVPADGQVFDLDPVEPGRRVGKNSLSFNIPVNLVHVVLDKGKLEACNFIRVIIAVQIDVQGRSLIVDVVDVLDRRDVGVVTVGKTYVDPFQRTIGLIIQHLPVDVVGHQQGGVFLYVYGNNKMLDLIGRLRRSGRLRKGGSKAQNERQQKGC